MSFTVQELNLIVRVCDIAIRHGGLETAQVALPLAAKAQQMAQAMQLAEQAASKSLADTD